LHREQTQAVSVVFEVSMQLGQVAEADGDSGMVGPEALEPIASGSLSRHSMPPATGAVGQSCHGPVGSRETVVVYEKAMRELYDRYPDDFEVQTFYALAVLAVGYATPADTTLSNQLNAATILEKLWKKNPNHPGVAHYLIHSYDYPALADRGLAAAKGMGSFLCQP
jgi:hypothetical protein